MLHISGIRVWPPYTRATRQSYSPHPSLRLRLALWKDSCWIAGSQATSPSTRCSCSKFPMPWCAPLDLCLKPLRRFQLGKVLPRWTSFIPGSLKHAGLHVNLFYYQYSLLCTQLSLEVMCIEPASEIQLWTLPSTQVGGQQLAQGPVHYTLLVNQTAIHGVPTALNAANQALLRAFTGQKSAAIKLVNHPLPMVLGEQALAVNQMSGQSSCHSPTNQRLAQNLIMMTQIARSYR